MTDSAEIIIFFVCFTPSLAWLGYFYIREEYEPGPLHLLLLVFGGGLLAGPLSLALFSLIERVEFYEDLTDIAFLPDYKKFLYAIMAIGLIEEVSKFLVFWFFVDRRHIEFTQPVDGIAYAAAAALGFATIENWYFMLAVEEPIWSRAITLPFNHVLFSSFWGAALGVAFYEGRRNTRLVAIGLALSIVFHGLYDYILFTDSVPGWCVAPLVLVLWLWLSFAIRDLLAHAADRETRSTAVAPEEG